MDAQSGNRFLSDHWKITDAVRAIYLHALERLKA
jgi:hypothetical protein